MNRTGMLSFFFPLEDGVIKNRATMNSPSLLLSNLLLAGRSHESELQLGNAIEMEGLSDVEKKDDG